MSERRVILITGGARSGKSSYALEQANAYTTRYFIATAEAFDEGMTRRIKRHQQERDATFITHEEPLNVGLKIKELASPGSVILVDCLTVWMGNLMHHQCISTDEGRWDECQEIVEFKNAIEEMNGTVILVANEVGLGVIPESEMGRNFQDLAGRLNQWIGQLADELILMVCGQPLVVKGRS